MAFAITPKQSVLCLEPGDAEVLLSVLYNVRLGLGSREGVIADIITVLEDAIGSEGPYDQMAVYIDPTDADNAGLEFINE